LFNSSAFCPHRQGAMPFSEKVEKALADLFDMVDTNKSGMIEKAEQQKAMKKIHSMMLPQVRWSWSDMDKNLDGKISKSEWHEAMQAIAAEIGVEDLVACIIRGWPDHPLALAEEHDAWGIPMYGWHVDPNFSTRY